MTARADIDEAVLDAAIAWQQALAADDADWDGYIAWLESDPRHREATDAVALIERAVDEHAPALRSLLPADTTPVADARPTRRYWLGGSLAAALAAAVAVPLWWSPAADTVYATGVGQTRRVALANGATIALAPQSRLVAEHGDADRLRVAAGEAYFDVRHDPSRTLTIAAGGYAVSDIGTRFSVNLGGEFVSVAVADGHVAVAPDGGTATDVVAGRQLIARRDGHAARLVSISASDVAGWRSGRLVYNDTPLGIVAADLARHLGRSVLVDPALRTRPFSGVLTIADGSRAFRNLADLMDLSYSTQGNTVRLGAGGGHR